MKDTSKVLVGVPNESETNKAHYVDAFKQNHSMTNTAGCENIGKNAQKQQEVSK